MSQYLFARTMFNQKPRGGATASGHEVCEVFKALKCVTRACFFFSKFYIDVVIMSQYLFARTMLNQKPRRVYLERESKSAKSSALENVSRARGPLRGSSI